MSPPTFYPLHSRRALILLLSLTVAWNLIFFSKDGGKVAWRLPEPSKSSLLFLALNHLASHSHRSVILREVWRAACHRYIQNRKIFIRSTPPFLSKEWLLEGSTVRMIEHRDFDDRLTSAEEDRLGGTQDYSRLEIPVKNGQSVIFLIGPSGESLNDDYALARGESTFYLVPVSAWPKPSF